MTTRSKRSTAKKGATSSNKATSLKSEEGGSINKATEMEFKMNNTTKDTDDDDVVADKELIATSKSKEKQLHSPLLDRLAAIAEAESESIKKELGESLDRRSPSNSSLSSKSSGDGEQGGVSMASSAASRTASAVGADPANERTSPSSGACASVSSSIDTTKQRPPSHQAPSPPYVKYGHPAPPHAAYRLYHHKPSGYHMHPSPYLMRGPYPPPPPPTHHRHHHYYPPPPQHHMYLPPYRYHPPVHPSYLPPHLANTKDNNKTDGGDEATKKRKLEKCQDNDAEHNDDDDMTIEQKASAELTINAPNNNDSNDDEPLEKKVKSAPVENNENKKIEGAKQSKKDTVVDKAGKDAKKKSLDRSISEIVTPSPRGIGPDGVKPNAVVSSVATDSDIEAEKPVEVKSSAESTTNADATLSNNKQASDQKSTTPPLATMPPPNWGYGYPHHHSGFSHPAPSYPHHHSAYFQSPPRPGVVPSSVAKKQDSESGSSPQSTTPQSPHARHPTHYYPPPPPPPPHYGHHHPYGPPPSYLHHPYHHAHRLPPIIASTVGSTTSLLSTKLQLAESNNAEEKSVVGSSPGASKIVGTPALTSEEAVAGGSQNKGRCIHVWGSMLVNFIG